MGFLSDSMLYLQYFMKKAKLKRLLRKNGLDFTGRIEDSNNDFRGYEGCYDINKILQKMNINSTDKILDVGCGKGLFLWYATKYKFSQIDGLEYSEELCKIAQNNLKIINDSRLNVINQDAREFSKYENYNYFFFNNPFSANIMFDVVKKILNSLKTNPRKIVIIYQFPFSKSVFVENGFKIKYEKFPNMVLTLE